MWLDQNKDVQGSVEISFFWNEKVHLEIGIGRWNLLKGEF